MRQLFLLIFLSSTLLGPAACGQTYPAEGGPASLKIVNPPGVAWTATTNTDWIIISGGAIGVGNGTVRFSASKNTGAARTGTITVGRTSYFVQQAREEAGALLLAGSFPHLLSGGGWDTTFTLFNSATGSGEALLNFLAEPGYSLDLLIDFPQQSPEQIAASEIDQYMSVNSLFLIDTQQGDYSNVYEGSAQLLSRGGIDGFATFTYLLGGESTAVPLETRNASAYFLPFDNTSGVAVGVAVANISSNSASIPVTVRDDTGAILGTDTLALPISGQTSFVLSVNYPVTASRRGTVEFDTPVDGQISVLGLRVPPAANGGFGLSTIPVLANVSSGTVSIPELLSGGGWQTTITLVNTGAAAAQAQLAFYNNQGAALSLPLSFPQSGNAISAATVSETLAPGATLVLVTNDPNAYDVGSAQITTNGPISGFATLRYNPTGTEAGFR